MELIRAIREGEVGDTIAVLSGDPGSKTDIPAWVQKAGHTMKGVEDFEEYSRFVVEKAR